MTSSLDGIRVLDLSRVLAGPHCAALLADLGADVIKVEGLTGDEIRHWVPRTGDESAAFIAVNRSKRGIRLDLRAEAGRAVLRRLLERADVLVDNFRAGTLESLGFGPRELQELNPGLVHCSVTAFGSTGPLRDAPGYEALVQAYSGVMSLTGEPGGDPVRCGVSFLDMSTGVLAAYGVLGALLQRERTGRGQRVETSLLETSISLLGYHAEAYLLHGTVAGPLGSGHPSVVPYRNFRCAGGDWVFVAAGNDRFFARLCAALGLEHLTAEDRFATNEGRVAHRGELDALIGAEIARHALDDMVALLADAGVPAAPVNTVDRLLAEPQVQHRAVFQPVPHATLGEIQVPAPPVTFGDGQAAVTASPTLGEHTDAVLREHGYPDAEIEVLRSQGVI